MLQMECVVSHGLTLTSARGKFVTWLKKLDIGRKDNYYGGYTIWVSEFGQSVTRKENYASALLRYLVIMELLLII